MKFFLLAFALLLVAGSVSARDFHGPHLEGVGVEGTQDRAPEEIFYECVEFCEIPAGWTVVNGGDDPFGYSWDNPFQCGTGMITCEPGDPSEGRSFYVLYGGTAEYQDEWLISPEIDATGYTDLVLTFAHAVQDWSYCTHPNALYVTTDGGANWDEVFSINCGDPLVNGTIYWENVNLPIEDTVFQLGIRYQGVWAELWWVDDILITGDGDPTPVEEASWGSIKGLYR